MEIRNTNYNALYNRMTAGIRSRRHGAQALRAADRILAGVMYAAYPVLLIILAVSGFRGRPVLFPAADCPRLYAMTGGVTGAFRTVLPYVLVPGISFVLVSFVRDRINWKRPYEEWPIDPLIHKETKGHSMPSRHVFSSAVISMCWLSYCVLPGVVLLILTLCSVAVRVLGGVHYPRDVAAGLVIGIAAGLFLWIL